jgi:hypothetical protein
MKKHRKHKRNWDLYLEKIYKKYNHIFFYKTKHVFKKKQKFP